MAVGASLQMFHEVGVVRTFGPTTEFKSSKMRHCHQLPSISLSSCASRQDVWTLHLADRIYKPMLYVPYRYNTSICRSFSFPHSLNEIPLKTSTLALTRSCNALLANPAVPQLISAVGIIAFAVWGLLPFMRYFRKLFHKDSNWKKSKTHYVSTSCLQPLLLWTGTMLICRAFDPIVLSSEASQVVKLRLLNFVKSLSTVLAFAYCLSSLIQKTQNFFMESDASNDTRKMGFQFAGRALYTVVWIAAVSLFMELLGFSTQKWITAGGLGTVLLTLAGREIFTNFLSSVMIHATRPFVVNQWIQTKIEGYEVSGTVEHVGWWSPTIIRGEDREAVHIPNHKFTVNVVRNLTQKTHWRIKTHLAISHLDVNKINNVVADMRKVLAKNSQIEQQRLHRRVFLENINLENQALLVLVSCFVKTSHFEEYLCVKEAILLDLLRVIRHHGARLATPIRTIQKTYGGTYMNTPYAETAFTRANAATDHPFYLIEAPPRTNGEDKAKARNTSRGTEEQTAKSAASSDAKVTSSNGTSSKISDKEQQNNMSSGDGRSKSSKLDPVVASSSDSPLASKVEPSDLAGSVSRAGDGKPSASESVNEKADDTIPPAHAKNGAERVAQPPGTKPAFEDNIVLGVALEGSKRTLPIEVGMGPGPHLSDANEHDKKGPSPSKKDNRGSTLSSSSQLKLDQRDQEW